MLTIFLAIVLSTRDEREQAPVLPLFPGSSASRRLYFVRCWWFVRQVVLGARAAQIRNRPGLRGPCVLTTSRATVVLGERAVP